MRCSCGHSIVVYIKGTAYCAKCLRPLLRHRSFALMVSGAWIVR